MDQQKSGIVVFDDMLDSNQKTIDPLFVQEDDTKC